MKKIHRIKIYNNDNIEANKISLLLNQKLTENAFDIVDTNPDLAIAIGGDGSFLRMVKKEGYNSDIIYVGINAGTLGFLQEIKIDEIDYFIECLKTNSYTIDEIGVQETKVVSIDKTFEHYSINEIVVREKELNTLATNIFIDDVLLEKSIGDGILIATSLGSTAYNLSFGGSIIADNFHTLQITPIAPLNSKAYRNLLNSVITKENSEIKLIPKNDKNNLLLSIDGENSYFEGVVEVITKVDKKRLPIFHLKNYNYWKKVNEKFLN